MDSQIEEIKNKLNVLDVVSGYVKLSKTGVNYRGVCPFHSEKTGSFSVNPSKRIFHCFGCGVGGDVFKYLELQEGLNFPEAVRQLAGKAGIPLPADSGSRKEDKRAEDERKALVKSIQEEIAKAPPGTKLTPEQRTRLAH